MRGEIRMVEVVTHRCSSRENAWRLEDNSEIIAGTQARMSEERQGKKEFFLMSSQILLQQLQLTAASTVAAASSKGYVCCLFA